MSEAGAADTKMGRRGGDVDAELREGDEGPVLKKPYCSVGRASSDSRRDCQDSYANDVMRKTLRSRSTVSRGSVHIPDSERGGEKQK